MSAREVLDGIKARGQSAGCAAHDDCLRANTARLTAAVEAVLDLHEHREGVWADRHGQNWEGHYCLECKVEFPCDTVENLTHAIKEAP